MVFASAKNVQLLCVPCSPDSMFYVGFGRKQKQNKIDDGMPGKRVRARVLMGLSVSR